MRNIEYNRQKAVGYALEWAMSRNPAYYDFQEIGGDCTNFISQCIYSGIGIMNFTPDTGWYYISLNNRAAAWTGVQYLQKFLLTNVESGPFATEIPLSEALVGDIIQLFGGGRFYHSLIITDITGSRIPRNILVSTHTFDARNRPLSTYSYEEKKVLHIVGGRSY